MKRLKATLPLAFLLLVSCMAYVIHPGAVNKSDSVAYDTLLIAQAVIDSGRAELAAGTLSETLKPGLNRLIDSYNVARASWLTYRNAIKAGTSGNLQSLKTSMDALTAALNAFQRSRSIP